MFEGLMKSFGYKKLTPKERAAIEDINFAYENEYDIFIDYLKTKKYQKIYIKDGKEIITKYILDDVGYKQEGF